ncbi:MAG: DUF3035 domain-containing protein [Rickettsiaceae bacterium]|nr:DUF3035 domain-containing protein [Rickettsiaceae bacterium]
MKKILLIIAALFLSIGCSSKTKKTFGLTETIPDEYQVQRNKSLEVPPHYRAQSPEGAKNMGVKKKKLSKSEQALLKEIE